jgi:Putative auto-transporter adhesin, head GIN domain
MRPGVGRTGVMRALLPRAALLAASLLVLPVHAETVKKISVSGFTKLDLKLPLDVTIRPGKEFSLTLTVRDSDVADKISAEVHGDTLVISTTEHSLRTHGKDKATLTMPDLRAVSISGSGNVDVAGFEQGASMALEIAGSGDITYSGKSSAMAVAIAGSGNVKLKGTTGSLSVNIEGSGDLQASEFSAKNASVAVSGSGDADLRVSGGAVQFTVNGSGDIRWSGEASVVSAVTHGSGSIKKH